MSNVLITKWPCTNCSVMLRKSERQEHEMKYEHKVAEKGIIQYPVEVKEEPKPMYINKFTGIARKDYPKTYEVMDALRGLIRYV